MVSQIDHIFGQQDEQKYDHNKNPADIDWKFI